MNQHQPNILPTSLAELYRRTREAILAEHPDIDPETLADTLEGASMLPDILADMIRTARERRARATALKSMIADMQERKDRFERGADKIEDSVFALIEAAGIGKLEYPDITISTRRNPPRVIVWDETRLTDEWCRISRLPDLNRIRMALKDGEDVPGCVLGNGGQSLSVRAK